MVRVRRIIARAIIAPKCLDGNVEGTIERRGAEKILVQQCAMQQTFESLTNTRNIIILKCIFLEIS
jgi:hypothetical protein